MFRLRLFFFALTFVLIEPPLQAQTLTAQNFNPLPGDTVVTHYLEAIDMLPTGPDSVWDYQACTSNYDELNSIFKTNDDTVHFPEATTVRDYFLVNGHSHVYYKGDSLSLVMLGGVTVYNSTTRYPQPLVIMPYPFYKGVARSFTTTTDNDTIIITLHADATGTLITCYKTYTNALRVQSNYYEHNDSRIGTILSYEWFVPGIHAGVFRVSKNTDSMKGKEISYTNSFYKGVITPVLVDSTVIEDEQILIYPNPTKDILTIKFHGIYLKEPVFHLTSSIGAIINASWQKISEKEFKLDLSALADGMYLLQMYDGPEMLKTLKVQKL